MKIMNPRGKTAIQQTHPPTAIQEQQTEPRLPPAPVPSQKTPQEFYLEITRRADVRTILEELATG